MVIEIKVPSPGESITQVQIASWLVAGGQYVDKNTAAFKEAALHLPVHEEEHSEAAHH